MGKSYYDEKRRVAQEREAALAEKDAEIERLNKRVRYYEHMIAWNVSCKSCADSLDKSADAYFHEENDKVRGELAIERGITTHLRAELEKARGLLGEARKWIATPSPHASLYQDIDAFLAGEET